MSTTSRLANVITAWSTCFSEFSVSGFITGPLHGTITRGLLALTPDTIDAQQAGEPLYDMLAGLKAVYTGVDAIVNANDANLCPWARDAKLKLTTIVENLDGEPA